MRPTFHQSRVCDLTVLERAPSLGEMEQLAQQIVPRSRCPGSRLEVSNWPCEACRSSRSHSHTQNDQHAGDLAVPVHPPPRLLPAPLLLHLPEAIGSGSCRLELRPDRSLDQPSSLGFGLVLPELPHGLGLGLFLESPAAPSPLWIL